MNKEEIIRKIEAQAKVFKSRAVQGTGDEKRHDPIKPDELKWMLKARNQLGWTDTKIGSVLKRDPRTVSAWLKKEQPKQQSDLNSGKDLLKEPIKVTEDYQPLAKAPEVSAKLHQPQNTEQTQLESMHRKLMHDEAIFKEADSILNERDILRIANNLKNGDAIYSDDDLKIAKFFDFMNLPATHQYLIKEISESYSCFTISLINLEKFMGKYIYPSDITGKYELWVTGDKHFKSEWDEVTWKHYYNLEAALHRLTDRMYKAYIDYRTNVTQKLQISPTFPQLTEEDVRKSDLNTFIESDVLLGEEWLYDFLNYVYQNKAYKSSQTERLRNYVSCFKYESNQYIGKERQELCSVLCGGFDELFEFLAVNNCPGTGDEDILYQLFPRSNPLFSLYLDRNCPNVDMTAEEISKRFGEFTEYLRNEENKKEFQLFVSEQRPFLYTVTYPNRPFTIFDHKREYYKSCRKLEVLLNQVEERYRAYRSVIRRTLGQ